VLRVLTQPQPLFNPFSSNPKRVSRSRTLRPDRPGEWRWAAKAAKELTHLAAWKYHEALIDASAQSGEFMDSFGETLRREREMRSVTLEEMSEATKISLHTLEALEAEELSKLPGGIFNRSFVRTYARYLGLDEDKVLAEYQAVCPQGEDVDLTQFNPVKVPAAKQTSRGRLVVLTLALALAAVGYVVTITSRQRLAKPVHPGPAPTSATRPESKALVETSASTAAEGTATTSPTARTASGGDTSVQGAGLVLQVAATEPSWVSVEADGKPAFQRILNPHDIQTVKATTSFDFVTGNAQGVILTLNGETLKPLGQHGEFKKLHLTLADLKNSAP